MKIKLLLLFCLLLTKLLCAQSIDCNGIVIHNYTKTEEKVQVFDKIATAFMNELSDFSDCTLFDKSQSSTMSIIKKEIEDIRAYQNGKVKKFNAESPDLKVVLFLEFDLITPNKVQVLAYLKRMDFSIASAEITSLFVKDFEREITDLGLRKVKGFLEELLQKEVECNTSFSSADNLNILINLFDLKSRCIDMDAPERILQEEIEHVFQFDDVEVIADCQYSTPIIDDKMLLKRFNKSNGVKADLLIWGDYYSN